MTKPSNEGSIANFQSVNNKRKEVLELIDSENPDVICRSEMWLNSTINSADIFPSSYSVSRALNGIPGGTLIAVKSDITVERLSAPPEVGAVFVKIHTWSGGPKLIIGSMYRPTNNDVSYSNLLCKTVEDIIPDKQKVSDMAVWRLQSTGYCLGKPDNRKPSVVQGNKSASHRYGASLWSCSDDRQAN